MERKRAGTTYNNEFKKTMADLYHAGNSVKDLNSEYDLSQVTIYKWAKTSTPTSSFDLLHRTILTIINKKEHTFDHYEVTVLYSSSTYIIDN
ncbi:hypothetical protein [Priestia megaterium]|uniref:hypothetical protein n=1 Tax=Priestia megaterium TaxID=1404 RepID=UPI00366C1208